MRKYFGALLLVVSYGCSQSENSPPTTSVEPCEQPSKNLSNAKEEVTAGRFSAALKLLEECGGRVHSSEFVSVVRQSRIGQMIDAIRATSDKNPEARFSRIQELIWYDEAAGASFLDEYRQLKKSLAPLHAKQLKEADEKRKQEALSIAAFRLRKEPIVGMHVRDLEGTAWGPPTRRYVTTSRYGTTETWYFDQGTLFVENDRVAVVSVRR